MLSPIFQGENLGTLLLIMWMIAYLFFVGAEKLRVHSVLEHPWGLCCRQGGVEHKETTIATSSLREGADKIRSTFQQRLSYTKVRPVSGGGMVAGTLV